MVRTREEGGSERGTANEAGETTVRVVATTTTTEAMATAATTRREVRVTAATAKEVVAAETNGTRTTEWEVVTRLRDERK